MGPSVTGLNEHVRKIIDDKVLNSIKIDPFGNEELHYELEGLWSYNKLKTGGRIIYAICEDCRKKGATIINNCSICTEMENDVILLWEYNDHDIYADLKLARAKGWKKFIKQKHNGR